MMYMVDTGDHDGHGGRHVRHSGEHGMHGGWHAGGLVYIAAEP
jgi:hypothetical protein